jgi:hypothetical protein
VPYRRSITALCIAMALPAAYGTETAEEPAPKLRKIPAISVLPDGSELEGVILPRYDQNLRLTGSLHADKLTLVGPEIIQGDNVHITLINPDSMDAPTQITLGSAILDQLRGIIRADEDVTILAARFTATGTALHLAFDEGRGFVSGPATTVILAPQKTAMHTPSTPRHPILATAALGMAVATSSTMVHAKPPAVSAEELAALHRDAASSAAELQSHAQESQSQLSTTQALSSEISQAARTFLINQVLEPGETPPIATEHGEAKPLEIEATPEDTRILSDGGFYFDAEAGILVYLQNVRVSDSRFTLDGVDELKIIFAKKTEAEAKEPKPESEAKEPKPEKDGPAAAFSAGVGEVERIIATGRVLFNQRQPQDGKPPVQASGALFNYDVAKGEIILSGGYPWVRQGGYYARALQPNLNLRIKRDGSFITEGNWDTGQNINR